MNHLLDTNIIIQILRANANLTNMVSGLNAVIDTTVYVESLQGQKSNADKKIVKNVLDNFPLVHFTPEISRRTIRLIDSYSNSHNLALPDAQIAACCLEYDLILLTYNIKDFRFIPSLKTQMPIYSQI